jgi:hypothetical protein
MILDGVSDAYDYSSGPVRLPLLNSLSLKFMDHTFLFQSD